MIDVNGMRTALKNKYRQEVSKRIKGYEKKVDTLVMSALEEEYNTVILGKIPKTRKPKAEKKSFSYNKKDE